MGGGCFHFLDKLRIWLKSYEGFAVFEIYFKLPTKVNCSLSVLLKITYCIKKNKNLLQLCSHSQAAQKRKITKHMSKLNTLQTKFDIIKKKNKHIKHRIAVVGENLCLSLKQQKLWHQIPGVFGDMFHSQLWCACMHVCFYSQHGVCHNFIDKCYGCALISVSVCECCVDPLQTKYCWNNLCSYICSEVLFRIWSHFSFACRSKRVGWKWSLIWYFFL